MLGPVPPFIFPYIGALKSWNLRAVFHFFGVSALTMRLPIILVAAATLLICTTPCVAGLEASGLQLFLVGS